MPQAIRFLFFTSVDDQICVLFHLQSTRYMKFLRQPFTAKAKDRIVISFDKPTRILLLNSSELSRYKKGQTYRYRGGSVTKSPVEFEVPFDGLWYAIIEKGTFRAPLNVTGSAKLLKEKYSTLNGQEQMETHEKLSEGYDDTLE